MQIAGGVSYREQRLKVEVQRDMAKRSQIDERRVSVRRLQSQGKIYGNGSGSASALGIDYGKNLASGAFLASTPLCSGKTHKGLKQVGRGGRPFNEFTSASTHGVDDDLGLIEVSDGEDGGFRHFLMQEFNRPQSQRRIVGRNIDQGYVWICGTHSARDGICRRHGETGAGVHRTGDAGAIDQDLQ